MLVDQFHPAKEISAQYKIKEGDDEIELRQVENVDLSGDKNGSSGRISDS